MQNFDDVATLYAEKYGIIDYKVKGSKMTYLVTYPKYLGNQAYTIRHTVDLLTFKCTTERLSRAYKSGYINRH